MKSFSEGDARRRPRLVGFYSRREEVLNSLTGGLGLMLSVAGLAWLILATLRLGDFRQILSFVVYGGSLLLVYLASTLYHSVQHLPTKRWLRVLDHSAIYVFIAGTYTPFLLHFMRGQLGWTLFAIVWSMAGMGVLYKTFFIHRFENLSTALYLAMGWLGVLGFREIVGSVPPAAFGWLLLGGIIYTVGVFFFAVPRVRYSHAVWHLFVLGGSACHYVAIVFHLLPAAV